MAACCSDQGSHDPRAAEVEGRRMLQLLNHCSGAFQPGILTALVGSSGAGAQLLRDSCLQVPWK